MTEADRLSPQPENGLIHMEQVVKTFHNTAGKFTALAGIDLHLQEGEFVTVIGKSGSGKSTLLNMLTGIDHPTNGKVIVAGVDVHAMSESKRSLWRGRNLGIVFQFFQLLPMLNLLENVMLPMDYVGMYDIEDRPKKAMALLDLVDLADQAQKLPSAVSRGQQQSAAVARALATDPPIMVADEPTGNLDSRSAARIIDLFDELSQGGKTIVIVTHDPSMTKRASRTLFISDGELVDETIAQALPLLTHPVMKELEGRVEAVRFEPGATIIERGKAVDAFYMIKQGQVKTVHKGRHRDDPVISTLNKNDFFGEIELLRGKKSMTRVQAGEEGPVELLALSRQDFQWLMDESPLTEKALGKVVQERLAALEQEDRPSRKRGLFGR